jgi:hypothetical protein
MRPNEAHWRPCSAKGASVVLVPCTDTHREAPLTHESHQLPTLADLNHFRVSVIITDIRLRRFCRCISCVSGVLSLRVSLLSADVAVVVVSPDVTAHRILISRSRSSARWNRNEHAVTMVQWSNKGFLLKNRIWYTVLHK